MDREGLLKNLRETFDKCLAICENKNKDYADNSDTFKNINSSRIINVKPELGLLVRMLDKITRMGNLIEKEGEHAVLDEALEDTVIDGIVYLAMLKAMLDSKNKKIM